MKTWVKKLRGLLGLGGIGGGMGALLGGAWAAVSSLGALGPFSWRGAMLWAGLWGAFGAFCGLGFGGLLATLGSRQTLESLRIWKAGALGFIVGGVFPIAGLMALTGTLFPLPTLTLLPIVGFCGGLGGLLTSAMVAMARRAHHAELRATPETRPLLEPD